MRSLVTLALLAATADAWTPTPTTRTIRRAPPSTMSAASPLDRRSLLATIPAAIAVTSVAAAPAWAGEGDPKEAFAAAYDEAAKGIGLIDDMIEREAYVGPPPPPPPPPPLPPLPLLQLLPLPPPQFVPHSTATAVANRPHRRRRVTGMVKS